MPETEANRRLRWAAVEAMRDARRKAWAAKQEGMLHGVAEANREQRRLEAAGRFRYTSSLKLARTVKQAHPAFDCQVCGQRVYPSAVVPGVLARVVQLRLCVLCLTWAEVRSWHRAEDVQLWNAARLVASGKGGPAPKKPGEPWTVRGGVAFRGEVLLGPMPGAIADLSPDGSTTTDPQPGRPPTG